MNWDDLKVVLAIHRAGSMSRAARLLAVDQSTITRRLAAFEADLGAVVFTRSQTGLRANDAGKVAIEQALAIEQSVERLSDRLPHRRGVPQGAVRLLSNPWLLTHLASHGLADLRASCPEIELVMIAGTQRRSIARGETDLALWFELVPSDGEFAAPVCDVPYALYAPAGVDPEGVDWMTVWNVKERIEPMRWLAKHLPADQKMALKTNDPPALLGAIKAGLGKALLPVCMAEGQPGVDRVRGDIPDVQRRMHLHAHPDLVGSPRIQGVMSWIREVCPVIFRDPSLALDERPGPAL